eukprot:10450843-Alexandrium_andersonii.AAC.1
MADDLMEDAVCALGLQDVLEGRDHLLRRGCRNLARSLQLLLQLGPDRREEGRGVGVDALRPDGGDHADDIA